MPTAVPEPSSTQRASRAVVDADRDEPLTVGDHDLVARLAEGAWSTGLVAFGDDVGEVDLAARQREHARIDVEHRPRAAGRAELQLAAIGDAGSIFQVRSTVPVSAMSTSRTTPVDRREREQPAGRVDRDQGFGPE